MQWNGPRTSQATLTIKALLSRAKHFCNVNQYSAAAKDYVVVLGRLEAYLASPPLSSSAIDLEKKRESYLLVKEWLCNCYLQMQQPQEVLSALRPTTEYTSLNATYLRARAYLHLVMIPEAIEELSLCKDDDKQKYDLTWIESNLLLASLYMQNRETIAAQAQLEFCQNALERWILNESISMIDYLNFSLETHYHLSQIYRIHGDIDAAIQTLREAQQRHLSYQAGLLGDQAINHRNINISMISIISQLFLLYVDQENTEAALSLLDDLSLFDSMATICTESAQAKALSALLLYAKYSYASGSLLKASSAFRVALAYMGGASCLENKSTIAFGLIFAANYYLLPEYLNPELALRYIELANKRLGSMTEQEKDIAHLELLLLQLAVLQYQGKTLESRSCFKELIAHHRYTQLQVPQNCASILKSTLTLFPKPALELFSHQLDAIELELQKYELANHSMLALLSLTDQDAAQPYASVLLESEAPLLFRDPVVTTSTSTNPEDIYQASFDSQEPSAIKKLSNS